jgi:hypothetical protein
VWDVKYQDYSGGALPDDRLLWHGGEAKRCHEILPCKSSRREEGLWEGLPTPSRGCPRGPPYPSFLPHCLYSSTQQCIRQHAGSLHMPQACLSPGPVPGSPASHNCLLKISLPPPPPLDFKIFSFQGI